MAKRKKFDVFNLSFLDCICCGFGAVILLFVVMNARASATREVIVQDLRGEVDRLAFEVLKGEKEKVQARNSLDEIIEELARTEGMGREVLAKIQEITNQLAQADGDTMAQKEHINQLRADVKSLEEGVKRLEGTAASDEQGEALISFAGDGERQYLSGLRLKGKRTLVLVDRSGSMIAPKVVDVLRLRNQDPEIRKATPKWEQTLRSVEWIMAKLPDTGAFHAAVYGEKTESLRPDGGNWWSGSDPSVRQDVIDRMAEVVPEGGTSLLNAFRYAAAMNPPPDNIVLLADGLPGMGADKPLVRKTVSSKRRLSLFQDAVRMLPGGVPVNILLYPMEGDPMASVAYWNLAVKTKGSLVTPSEDWP